MAAKRKKKLNKGKFLRFIIILLLFVGGIISLMLYAPFFNVSEVIITGNDAVAPEDILNSTGISIGTNIFKVDKGDVVSSLKRISRIETVSVKRKLPKSIEVTVTETYPELIFPYMSGYVITNEKGKVIELSDNIEGYTFPVINGVTIKEAIKCKLVAAEDEVTFDIITDYIDLLKKYDALSMFKEIDLSNLSNFFGYTHDGVKVIFGKMTDIEYKIKVFNDVITKVDKSEGAYIDLSTPAATVYGIAEPTEEPTEETTEETETAENTEATAAPDETGEVESAE